MILTQGELRGELQVVSPILRDTVPITPARPVMEGHPATELDRGWAPPDGSLPNLLGN